MVNKRVEPMPKPTSSSSRPRRKQRGRRTWGSVERLPTGEWRARFTAPNGRMYTARDELTGKGLRFQTKQDADAWLARERTRVLDGKWKPPAATPTTVMTLRRFAEIWIRRRDLEVRSAEHYEQLLRDHINPVLGDLPLPAITPTDVDAWYANLDPKTPTARAHAYGLLRTLMSDAANRDLIGKSPCRIRGAGQTKRARTIRPATLDELQMLVQAVPARYEVMVLLAAWCALRFGELTELRRSDVEIVKTDGVKVGTLRITRGVVRTKAGEKIIKDPKSAAGKRTVAIPPHLIPAIEDHLAEHVAPGKDALLFPSRNDPDEHMTHSTLNKVWLRARAEAGRDDLAFHDLRHTGATLAAATGATLAELMARLGHSTPVAAMRYQHAAADRDRVIADALSALASGNTK